MSLSKPINNSNNIINNKSGNNNSTSAIPRSNEDNIIISLWHDYLTELRINPLRTKAITSAVTSIISDILAQIMLGASINKLNYRSIMNQTIIGFILRG